MPRITLIHHAMHDLEVLRQLTPAGLEVTVVERRGQNFAAVYARRNTSSATPTRTWTMRSTRTLAR